MAEQRSAERTWKYWTEPTFVDVDGVRTAYRRGGEGETVLYLHGGGGGTRSWLPFHRALAERFDVVAPEHPGYGDSERDVEQDTFEDYVLHYEAFIRRLGLGRVHLVGWSLGAWIAADLAIHHPDRFASITLLTPFGTRLVDEPLIDAFRFTADAGSEALFNGRADGVADQVHQEGGMADVLQAFAEDSTAALLTFDRRYDHKLDRRLGRVALPALVIGAEDDRIVGDRQAARFAELLPDAELLLLPGPGGERSSHGLVFEQPTDVADAISTRAVARAVPLER